MTKTQSKPVPMTHTVLIQTQGKKDWSKGKAAKCRVTARGIFLADGSRFSAKTGSMLGARGAANLPALRADLSTLKEIS